MREIWRKQWIDTQSDRWTDKRTYEQINGQSNKIIQVQHNVLFMSYLSVGTATEPLLRSVRIAKVFVV